MEQRIEKTVRGILGASDMSEVTEHKIRKLASAELDLDLSKQPYKAFVKQVVQSFLDEQQQQQQQQQEEEEEEEQAGDAREYDEEGNPIICKVSISPFPIPIYLFIYFSCLVAEKV